MIELRDVRKTFNSGKPNEFTAVEGITLTIPAGRATVLKGPSGSGKTTLLGLIGGMARPTAGRIFVSGREITSLPERFLTEVRRRTFGFVFQQSNLIRGISALENAMLPAYPLGEPHGSIRKRALRLFERFGIAAKADSRAEWLSGGEAQRVVIVRALMNDPPVIIADEPTAHLDSKLSAEFMAILAGLKAEGRTLLLASHDPLVNESSVVDKVIGIHDGRIDEAGE